MARYRKIEVATWTDERFMHLSPAPPNAQTLWLYLLTGQRTTSFPGLVIGREEVMASDLGWSVEDFRRVAKEVTLPAFNPQRLPPGIPEGWAKPLAKADWRVGLVVLQKALIDSSGEPRETAKPNSPNVIKSWAKSWDEVPECYLKYEYLQTLRSFTKGMGDTFAKAFEDSFRKALAKPSPIQSPTQNQEQEQEQKQEQEKEESPPAARTSAPPSPRVKQPKLRSLPSLEAVQAADRLMQRIIANHPTSTLAGLSDGDRRKRAEKWAEAFRLLHERDKHTWGAINAMVDWCQRDDFWKGVILSGDKFREKWDVLTAQRNRQSADSHDGRYGRIEPPEDFSDEVDPFPEAKNPGRGDADAEAGPV